MNEILCSMSYKQTYRLRGINGNLNAGELNELFKSGKVKICVNRNSAQYLPKYGDRLYHINKISKATNLDHDLVDKNMILEIYEGKSYKHLKPSYCLE